MNSKRPQQMSAREASDVGDALRLSRLLSSVRELLEAVDALEGVEMPFPNARDLSRSARKTKRLLEDLE